MNRKVARPLGNGAIQRVNGIFNLPTELVNEKGETIFVLIDTFNKNELFNLSNYWFRIHIKGSKYNTIETFVSEEIKKLKIIQGWFDATKEKEYFFTIQHYIDYLETNFKSDFERKKELNIKNEIAIKLIGLTDGDATVFHHIKRVLKEYNITSIEGREILLEMQGTFNNAIREKRLPEVIKFLEDIKALPNQQTETEQEVEQPIKSKQYPKIETKEIIESGFIKAYIAEYFEYKIHSFYPDKDRLLYVLCSTDLEKQQVTTKQIEIIKSEIQKLGNEDLSYSYLLSGKPKSISAHEYIEPNKRFDFWLNRFGEYFIDSINSFTPIIESCELFKGKLSNEDFENEFWEMYPVSQTPKEKNLPFLIQRESELLNVIEYTISEYKENEYWEFDFEEYQKFIDISKPLELLFNISELLVQLNRLEMYNDFLLPHQQTETKTDKLKAELGKYGFFELPKVKQLSEPNKQSLIELISTNDLPYSIAMVEYLGFIKYLKSEHFTTDYKLFKAVAKWFEVDERAVKGNIYVLNEHSKENRTRYTADQQKQIVQKDYEKLK